MDSLNIQYIIIGLAFLFAAYSLYKVISKNFKPKKFSSKHTGCDSDCGCS